MKNRIDTRFETLKAQSRKAFVAYIAAGDPTPQHTPELVWALERAGADVIELGVPFSDPLADGVVNQLAAQRALSAGTTVTKVLEIIRKIRTQSEVPLVLFTYLNPILRFGLENFVREATAAGADGLLILDLPPEEQLLLGDGNGPGLHRIQLVAPTTPPERIPAIVANAGGFVYYVSREGVTGMQSAVAVSIPDQVARLRKSTAVPVCVGFGISSPEQAAQVAVLADGAVVGSALVNAIAAGGGDADLPEKLGRFAQGFAEAIHWSGA